MATLSELGEMQTTNLPNKQKHSKIDKCSKILRRKFCSCGFVTHRCSRTNNSAETNYLLRYFQNTNGKIGPNLLVLGRYDLVLKATTACRPSKMLSILFLLGYSKNLGLSSALSTITIILYYQKKNLEDRYIPSQLVQGSYQKYIRCFSVFHAHVSY